MQPEVQEMYDALKTQIGQSEQEQIYHKHLKKKFGEGFLDDLLMKEAAWRVEQGIKPTQV